MSDEHPLPAAPMMSSVSPGQTVPDTPSTILLYSDGRLLFSAFGMAVASLISFDPVVSIALLSASFTSIVMSRNARPVGTCSVLISRSNS